ncbi:MAG TPA: hypothetical protein PLL75_01085 [Candidatus Omnitrophota bacterium]|nr:hypothetical protein [Candidatus Omnitrophota bacterium]HPS36308.1 hypothetical protein [Candidatus Omnitrophota bacterium]
MNIPNWRSFLLRLKDRPALVSFFVALVLVVALCILFTPRWEQNDDVCMSMVAHGYGLAAHSSPNLVYSNVLWGHLVRAIPPINGVLGYSLAAMATLVITSWMLFYFLVRLGAGYLPSLLAMILIMARPILFPQFTFTAGLLTATAIIGWRVHTKYGDLGSLVAACLLALGGFLIRGEEFFLVLGVGLPLLPWKALWHQRSMRIGLIILALVITSAAALDLQAYNAPEWKFFNELNSARTPFADYDGGKYLKQRPDILARYGYSDNDIDLLSCKFFVDTSVANPKAMSAMMAELGPLYLQKGRLASGFEGFKGLVAPQMLPLYFGGLLLLCLIPHWSAALTWVFCLTALFMTGWVFRPCPLRVCLPLMSLLFVAPLLWGRPASAVLRRIALGILIATFIWKAYILIPQGILSKKILARAQDDARHFPRETIFSWGTTFPSELVFPVLSNDTQLRNIRWYSMNVFTHAPFSVATADTKAGRGLLDRWHEEKGVPIIQSAWTPMLETYCREHWDGELQGTPVQQRLIITVQKMRCA